MLSKEEDDKVCALCRDGDVAALQILFSELNVGPDYSKDEVPPGVAVASWLWWAGRKGENANMFDFLRSYFSTCRVPGGTLKEAFEKDNVNMVRAICKLDPDLVKNRDWNSSLGDACGMAKNPEIIKVLLDAGAKPDDHGGHQMLTNAEYLISNDFPAATLELFFDAGYKMTRGTPVEKAVEVKRADMVEVLYRRGRKLPGKPSLPRADELMKLAERTGDKEMIAMVKSLFPKKYSEERGFLASMLQKLKS